MSRPLTIALSKGRILEETVPLLQRAGIEPAEDVFSTRKLIVEGAGGVRFLLIRAADVCTYVEHGAADLGIVGRDLLLEARPNVHEPLDLGIGRCRLSVAAPLHGNWRQGSRVRVATKYDRLTEDYFLTQGVQAEIIHLYGSMELAPLMGMADCIVDLISTGGTLKANNLVEEAKLFDISSRLIVNPASRASRRQAVESVIQRFKSALGTTGDS